MVDSDNHQQEMSRRNMMGYVGAAAASTTALSGCLGGNGGDSGTSISFWQTWSDAEYEIYDSWQETWLNENPDWSIDQEKIPHDSRRERVTTAVSTNSLPDIHRGNYPNQYLMAEAEQLAPLDDYFSEWDQSDDFIDGVVEACTYQDKLIAWPQDIFSLGFYYRKDIFEEAGLESFPQTYDEFIEACEAIVEGTDAYPYSMAAGVNGETMNDLRLWVWSCGGGFASQENEEWTVEFDSEASILGLERYAGMVHEGFAPDSVVNYGYGEVRQGWESGDFAMMTSGSWDIANQRLNNPDLEYGIETFPTMPETGTYKANVDATWYAISRDSDYIEESVEYLKWLTDRDHVTEWATELDHMPIRESVRETDYFQQDLFDAFRQNQDPEHAVTLEKTAKYQGSIQDPAEQALQDVVLGNKTADEAAKDAADEMRNSLQGE